MKEPAEARSGASEGRTAARQIVASLPTDQKSAALETLLSALRLAHRSAIGAACRGTLDLLDSCAWLRSELSKRLDLQALEFSIQRVLASGEFSGDRTWGRTQAFWPTRTLRAVAECEIVDLAPLAGIFLVALIDGLNQSVSHPPLHAIEQFGQLIRGIAKKRAAHTLRADISGLAQEGNFQDCAGRFGQNLLARGDRPRFGESWHRHWLPWIQSQASISVGSPLQSPLRHGGTVRRPRTVRLPLPALDAIEDLQNVQEPVEEAATTLEVGHGDPTPASLPEPDPAQQRALFIQAIRQRNTELLPGHIDVLSQTELQQILAGIGQTFEAALKQGDVTTAAAAVTYQLLLATGRTLDRVLRLPVVHCAGLQQPADLELDLDRGAIRQPVLQPEIAHLRAPTSIDRLRTTQSWFSLPLPPQLVERLRRLVAIRAVVHVRDWFGDGSSAFAAIKTLLHSIDGLPEISTSLGRARRWISARLMEHSGDLAATMLLCGDPFGRATTPLFYYAPKISHLRALYRSAIWPVFGDDARLYVSSEEGDPGARTGTGLVLDLEDVQAGLHELRERLDRAIPRHWTVARTIEHHNLFTTYVLLYFCIITSHRPTRALLELRSDDLDPDLRLAIVSDKKVDAAHLHRPAALSADLARQLQHYFDHLGHLTERTPSKQPLAQACRDALASRCGFFFFLDGQGLPCRSLKPWITYWPQRWRDWPANWYRHYAATHLREVGAPATLVLAQMGHLEAASFPFSSSSLLGPAAFARALQEPLSEFERLSGLRPHQAARRSRRTVRLTPPLRSWTKPLRILARDTRWIEQVRRRQIFAATREHRKAGLQIALGALDAIAPALAARVRTESLSAGHRNRQSRANPAPGLTLDETQAARLLEVIEQSSHPPAVRIAAHLEIGCALRQLRRRDALPLADVGLPFAAPPAEPTALFPGALLATRQVRRLRQAFIDDSPQLRAKDPDLHLALALVLYGGVTQRSELRSVLAGAARAELVRIAGPRLLVPHGGHPTESASGFSGTAALALAGAVGVPRSAPSDAALSTSFRRWCRQQNWEPKIADSLGALLETVAVAHRIEQSGVARHAASLDGCAGSPYTLQCALLTDALVPGARRDRRRAQSADPSSRPARGPPVSQEEDRSVLTGPTPTAKLKARRFLRRMSRTWHPSAQATTTRRVSLREVRRRLVQLAAPIDPQRRLLIEEALALFALELATVGTAKRAQPATATLATYLTAVGGDLIDRLAGIDLHALTADDLLAVYLGIVESKALSAAPRTARRTAEQLCQFHKVLTSRLGFEPIPVSEFAEYLPESRRAVDADAITAAEYRAARAWLTRALEAEISPLVGTRRRREVSMVRLALDLLYASGARISEVVLLRHADVFIGGHDVVLFIRPTIYRRLKTAAGRRRVDLGGRLSAEAVADLRAWLEAERLRRGHRFRCRDLLFPELESSRRSPGVGWFRERITDAFAQGASRRCWPHLMRHHRVFSGVRSLLESPAPEGAEAFEKTRMLRSLATELGHASITTRFSAYLHLPWLVRSVECRHLSPAPNRHALAALSGLKLSYVDKLGQRPPPRRKAWHLDRSENELTWVERILVRNAHEVVPATLPLPSTTGVEEGDAVLDFGVRALDALLRACVTPEALHRIGLAWGLSKRETEMIEMAVRRLASETRYQLLPRVVVGGKAHPVRTARPLSRLDAQSLSERLDETSQMTRTELARLFERCYRVRAAVREQRFVGKAEDIHRLHELLSGLGVQHFTISESHRSGLVAAGFSRHGTSTPPFHLVCRILALNTAREYVLGASPFIGVVPDHRGRNHPPSDWRGKC